MTRSRLFTREMELSAGKDDYEDFERLLREGALLNGHCIRCEEKTVGRRGGDFAELGRSVLRPYMASIFIALFLGL